MAEEYNSAFTGEQIDEAINTVRNGVVKTVNGIIPDKNGNVEVSGGVQSDWNQNDTTALDYVKNRTHWAEKTMTDTLTFDGNVEGKEVWKSGFFTDGQYIRVSDDFVSFADLVGGTYTVRYVDTETGEIYEDDDWKIEIREDMYVLDLSESFGFTFYVLQENSNDIIVAAQDFYDNETLIAKKGISFFFSPEEEGVYISELKAPSAVLSGYEAIHKLDNKFLDLAWLPTAHFNLLIEETTLVFEGSWIGENNRLDGFGFNDYPAGTKVTISMDGKHYPVTVVGMGSGAEATEYVGNLAVLNSDYPNTGEPFYADLKSTGAYFIFKDNEPHQVAIYKTEYNKMPTDFMPDDATELYLTSPNGTRFKITVSDDGTLSATEVTS